MRFITPYVNMLNIEYGGMLHPRISIEDLNEMKL